MGNVGLLYVGAVLFVNGLMLLDVVPARSAAVLNLFVGALQCVLPTVMLVMAAGDPAAVLAASGLYLFGFTYLYVGIVNLTGLEPQGIGWFSLFVAGGAVVYSALSFTVVNDPVFGVIWLAWAVLWLLFFLVLGLRRARLTRFTGWSVVLLSQPTCTLPAFLMLSGNYRTSPGIAAIWAVGLAALLLVARVLSAHRTHQPRTAANEPVFS
ncbi:AmiS/UreI family transporter [Mycolicibacterium fortuitum]|uniref:UreI-like protein n=2 Tax=Mycolicibacterium fortuitum TaxID=1766 RepID=A0A0N9XPA0_MYCFO|nr:AmiS/UreI family transporter [Mycolicibacterium fortuitum]AIY45452.1 Urea channel UreI [Mycobacterium sp. VKM Ac-1817D]CRL75649.1 amidate substrates transporter protein [Mycolicibacter nonchromogenicus]ALI25355.1 UreI-like protein [Mycolicibacterium fortuitum]AMD56385.1 transporter [Mycolicibacterium fortuitum subsp. fortuitum DSM 46621 = ATCC 6841 = JCM 6387]EJZ10312.1 amidase substrates transport protein [Mycolicibacterium fortuitum subsp. fortuitum DSM 46621 = ATCC 6841 = JCM 6387]